MLICMEEIREKFDHAVSLLQCIHAELKLMYVENKTVVKEDKQSNDALVHIPFRGTELYLLHKAFIDSGGAPAETYKSLLEKTASQLANKNQKGFSVDSLQKIAIK